MKFPAAEAAESVGSYERIHTLTILYQRQYRFALDFEA